MHHDRFLRFTSVFLCIFTMILGIAVFKNIRAVEDENAITRKTTYNAAALVRRELKTLQEASSLKEEPAAATDAAVSKTVCFILREKDGVLCVFDEEGVLKRNTGVVVRSLPDADKARLCDGICVYSEEELAMLIGDLST